MHPDFARVVDPIFAYVLNLLSRIDDAEQKPSSERERDEIKLQFDKAEKRLPDGGAYREQWELSKYALTVWTDEVLINAENWSGKNEWAAQPLEMEFFKSNEGAQEFYRRALDAKRLSSKDALEVFYLGVMLGFQGLYDNPQSASRADQLGLPPTREKWATEVGEFIRPTSGGAIQNDRRRLEACEPLLNGRQVIGALLLLVLMLCAFLISLYYYYSQSDLGNS